jgi:hypothetical protein
LNDQTNETPKTFVPVRTQQQRWSKYVWLFQLFPFQVLSQTWALNLTFLFITVQKFIFCGMKAYNV